MFSKSCFTKPVLFFTLFFAAGLCAQIFPYDIRMSYAQEPQYSGGVADAADAVERVLPRSGQQIQLSYAPLVREVAPAVVNIYTSRTVTRSMRHPFLDDPFFGGFFGRPDLGGRMRQQVENSLGSGVILEAEGLVVTNAHVIRGAEQITVVLADGREFEARLSLEDSASDLAVLRVDTKGERLPFVALKPSETLEVGDIVLAIGNPFGVGQTVTSGIVSAQGRSSLNINDFNFFIQTDAAINPGNSGGPLVALDGGVVGINTAIYSRDGGSLGIGFAVPSEMVASVVAAEKSGQSGGAGVLRPWLGITAQAVSADIAESLGLQRPAGVLIAKLHSVSPLAAAGLRVGDVVSAIDGRTVRDPAELKFRMAMVSLGQEATFDYIRQGRTHSAKVKAIAPPDTPPRQATTLSGNHPLSGAVVGFINPAVAVELGLSEDDEGQGVAILEIPQGAAARRVARAGDLIVAVNGAEVNNPADVERALRSPSPRGGWELVLKRAGQTRQVIIR
jgi:serine protease Do